MKSTPYRPQNKSILLLLWIVSFLSFNYWFLQLLPPSHPRESSSSYRDGYSYEYSDDNEGHDYGDSLEEMPLDLPFDSEDERDGEMELSSLGDWSGEKRGKIAWLMSFPNSGTSFTSLLIRHASNATTASNYGMECNPGRDGKSVPVHEWSPKGPYWLHPPSSDETSDSDAMSSRKTKQILSTSGTDTGKSGSYNIPPVDASVLTKTHCGSRCNFCPPNKYLETWQSFLVHCLSGARSVPITTNDKHDNIDHVKSLKNANPNYQKQYVTYHPTLVEKAVHLIRNPFDNLVSRFHHEQKEHKKRHDTQWTRRYSNDPRGFRKWCADEDTLFRSHEQSIDWKSLGYDPHKMQMHFEGVACHAEFFRYVQWHNLAVVAVQKLDIPVMYVHYEDYTTDLKGETDRMLQFLNLERVGILPTFDSNKDYSDYFSLEERAAASELMRVAASDEGRKLMERYWVELDYRAMRKQIQAILD